MLPSAFLAHGKGQNNSSGWLFPPCQIPAPEHKDAAIQAGIDGMQQRFLNETQISQPRRVPRPSRVWLTPEGPGSAALVSAGVRGAVSSRPRFSDGCRQLPPAPTRRVPGRARNSSEVLISGLKERPHDSNHAAPLLLCDGGRGFHRASVKRDRTPPVDPSPGAAGSQAHLQHPKAGRCSVTASRSHSPSSSHGRAGKAAGSLWNEPIPPRSAGAAGPRATHTQPNTTAARGCPDTPLEPPGNAKPEKIPYFPGCRGKGEVFPVSSALASRCLQRSSPAADTDTGNLFLPPASRALQCSFLKY